MVTDKKTGYGNTFFFLKKNGQGESVGVSEVCELTGVDIRLVQDIYNFYRNHERWPLPCSDELDTEIFTERMQIITDLFPFPVINWQRESPTGGSWCLGTFENRQIQVNTQSLRKLCEPGRRMSKAWMRRLKRKIQLRLAKRK
jgi:hypothetical protein